MVWLYDPHTLLAQSVDVRGHIHCGPIASVYDLAKLPQISLDRPITGHDALAQAVTIRARLLPLYDKT